MSVCVKCEGRGYIEIADGGNKICSCKLAESVKNALAKHPNVLLAKDRKFNLELFPENTVVSIASMDKINTILKTVFTYMFLKGTVKSMDILDSHTLMESHFEKSEYYNMSVLKESDFVVVIIDSEKQNKIMPEVLLNFTKYRKNLINKPTWIVYINEGTERKIENLATYAELVKSLNSCKFTFRSIK